jgi:hypothetical protein
MRHGFSIFILSLIILAIIIVSFLDNSKPGEATPSPTVAPNVTATPTVAPNVTATPTTMPDISGTIHSSQIRLASLYIAPESTSEIRRGDFNITLENVGSSETRNVSVSLVLTDMRTLEKLYDLNYTLDRSIPAHDNNRYTLATGLYGPRTESVIINLRIYWGDRHEFWNAYNMTRALPWIQPAAY